MFKAFNLPNCPEFYRSKFLGFKKIHKHNTRKYNCFKFPLYKISKCQRLLFYQGPKFWDLLPIELRLSRSLFVFKKELKKLLIDKY